ncbi:site-specific tyrosine recombinase XerC (plasmid) [Streptomyces sp. YIM 121038]|uniref:tyrosine-type recombinase/integrase n=1 Tax=Streptomyces sp. YIM 121038 TaxID=2136401 RepID=UPI0011641343|nr:tyrosine-type recombinase/integrase [Streptomyces sp. YIM 121038]QCX82831.1 site-specific tyrosine recombinase XerC [Streptomyces sp. YIM 121038]
MVVDESFGLHAQACSFLSGREFNTGRTYAPRVALYLSWCMEFGVEWTEPSLAQLMAFQRWLVEEPLAPRSRRPGAERRYRERGTANQITDTMTDFLRWCSLAGLGVPATVVTMLVEPRFLRFPPAGFDPGEDSQNLKIDGRRLKFRVAVPGYGWLTDEEVHQLLAVTTHARDRFLVGLLAVTGMRIGEALGLRREDMHLLPDSRLLGCHVKGPHVHVRRRVNSNDAFAKSVQPRWIPVEEDTVGLYTEYRYEREAVSQAVASDMVFVNLFRAPLGRPMRYDNTYELFKRLAKRAGFRHCFSDHVRSQMARAARVMVPR